MNCVRKCGFTDCFFHAPISLPGAILVFTVCGNANQFELITGINTVCFYVLHGDILIFCGKHHAYIFDKPLLYL